MQNSQRRTERKNLTSKIQDKDVIALRLKRTDVLKNVASVNSKAHLVLYISYITAQQENAQLHRAYHRHIKYDEWMDEQWYSWWTMSCKFKRFYLSVKLVHPVYVFLFIFLNVQIL